MEITVGTKLELETVALAQCRRQPRGSKMCGQYAAARVLGLNPRVLIREHGNGPIWGQEMADLLNTVSDRQWLGNAHLLPMLPALILVKDPAIGDTALHWLAWLPSCQAIYDPLQQRGTWQVVSIIQPAEVGHGG